MDTTVLVFLPRLPLFFPNHDDRKAVLGILGDNFEFEKLTPGTMFFFVREMFSFSGASECQRVFPFIECSLGNAFRSDGTFPVIWSPLRFLFKTFSGYVAFYFALCFFYSFNIYVGSEELVNAR